MMSKMELKMNGLTNLFKLHEKTARRTVDNILDNPSTYVLMLLTNEPGAGKTNFLEHFKIAASEFTKRKNIITEFLSNKIVFGNSLNELLKSNKNGSYFNSPICKTENENIKIIIIDDLDDYFDHQYEELIKKIYAGDFQEKIIVIATSKINAPVVKNNSSSEKNMYDISSSQAIHLFTPANIEPIWADYCYIVQGIFDDCHFFPKGFADAGQELLIQDILKFSGPFPPVIKKIVENLVFGVWQSSKMLAFSDETQHQYLAEELLSKDLKYVYFAALDWIYAKLPSQRKNSDAMNDPTAFYQMALPYLGISCLIWGSKSGIKRDLVDFDFKKIPCLFETAFNSWRIQCGHTRSAMPNASTNVPERNVKQAKKGRKTVDKVPYDTEGGGGRLVIKDSNGNKEDEIELSPVEWLVFSCLQEGKTVEVRTIADQLGQDIEFTEAKIRSALSRIDDKLRDAQVPWIMQNFPRRGYLLRVQEPDGENR